MSTKQESSQTQTKESRPLLSILTRCFARPKGLERNKLMMERQTDQNFEQLFVVDEIGQGVHWANQQIAKAGDIVNGQYVMVLDDDDFIMCDDFIEGLQEVVTENSNPPVIICRGFIHERPMPKVWREGFKRGTVGAPNVITRTNLFKRCCSWWDTERAGDYNYFKRLLAEFSIYDVCWWDKFVFYADPSCGLTEEDKDHVRFEQIFMNL